MTSKRGARLIALTLLIGALAASGAWAQVSGGRGGYPGGGGYPFVISSNVPGATVYINGVVSGSTPYSGYLYPGAYAIIVRAPGYQDYSTTLRVNGPVNINAYLTGFTVNLSIVSNVQGAQVIVNGQASGQTPLTLAAQPGLYTIQVSASGYQPFSTQVQVSRDTTINAQLQANFATLRIVLPGSFFNPDWDRTRADNDIGVWIDGRRVGHGDIQVAAGNHTIRFGSGGLSVQSTYYFNPGQLYVVSPQLSIVINPSN